MEKQEFKALRNKIGDHVIAARINTYPGGFEQLQIDYGVKGIEITFYINKNGRGEFLAETIDQKGKTSFYTYTN